MKSSLQDLSNLKVGILGGGQLGWMMILECVKYPLTFYVMDRSDSPACRVADRCFSIDRYREMIDEADIITYEFEHVFEDALKYAEAKGKLIPGLKAVELKRERWREKKFFKENMISTPRFFITEDRNEVLSLIRNEFNYSAVVKQSKGGYDGKGQYFVRGREDLSKLQEVINNVEDVFIVEEYLAFDYEASVILARDHKGNIQYYPPTYNKNESGILIYNYGPLPDNIISRKIINISTQIASKLNYVGVMAVEFFVKDDEVLVNEFAPRVHNTGHYTLDASNISQFEQHIRAIIGLELMESRLITCGGMVNIIGLPLSKVPLDVLRYGKLYWYGKSEVRRRRKMGHINVVGSDVDEVKHKINTLMDYLYPEGLGFLTS